MLQLKNKFLSAGFDEMGRIVELVNNTADYGNVIEYPAGKASYIRESRSTKFIKKMTLLSRKFPKYR
jgi:hypothetical protein